MFAAETADSWGALIYSLGDRSFSVREKARMRLARMGKPVVPTLIEALSDPNRRRRWEAAKALGQIGDRRAAEALVRALVDEDPGVRWVAADALVALGSNSLAPLLRALIAPSSSVWLRHGAHHVLGSLLDRNNRSVLEPVLNALDGIQPNSEVPVAAARALDRLPAISFISESDPRGY